MSQDYPDLDREEQLKAENNFLRMKLMLEHGGQFNESIDDVPPELENAFLNHVMQFEEQFHQCKTITVYEKIGSPGHFKPVAEIPTVELEENWEALNEYLNAYGIHLDVCSPNIIAAELYRFTVEELFKLETNDMDIPGMMTCFIYDEFYPDPKFKSEKLANDLLHEIFSIDPIGDYFYAIKTDAIRVNQKNYTTEKQLKEDINLFKSCFSQINLDKYEVLFTEKLPGKLTKTNGLYQVTAVCDHQQNKFEGKFSITTEENDKLFQVSALEIEGIDFTF